MVLISRCSHRGYGLRPVTSLTRNLHDRFADDTPVLAIEFARRAPRDTTARNGWRAMPSDATLANMAYAIVGLDPEPFHDLIGRSDADLASRGAVRRIVDARPGYPCRISLVDADVGESVLLLNHTYQPAETPYHGSHAIYIRESATGRATYENEIPAALRVRLLSIRAFDATHYMTDADVVEGSRADATIERLFANADVAYLHIHNAKRGCFAARVERRPDERGAQRL